LGDLALKLERYRYNLIASMGWVIFGSIFSIAVMVLSALILLKFDYAVLVVIPAGIISLILFHRVKKLVSPIDSWWKWVWIPLFIPFIIFYSVIPQFLNFSDLQMGAYYSTAWYPSLGVAFVIIGLSIERKDDMLVTKTMLPAGIAVILTTIPLAMLCTHVRNYIDITAMGLIAASMMLTIYISCGLYSFFRGYKVLFNGK